MFGASGHSPSEAALAASVILSEGFELRRAGRRSS